MKKRILAGILSAVLVVATALSLAACADNKKPGSTTANPGNNNTTTPGTNAEGAPVKPNLPTIGTEDEHVVVNFAVSEADNDGFHKRSIGDEDYNTENDVDAAVHTRNQRIAEELYVDIVIAEYNNNGIRGTDIGKALIGQDDTYDVVCGVQWTDCELVLDQVLADLTMLVDDDGNPINYINFNAKYWSSYYIDAMKCGEAIFWLTGDLCLRYTGGFYCFIANTQLYDETLKETYGALYDVVKSGKWTYDTLLEMSKKAFRDLDGDESKTTRDDQQGVAIPQWDNINGMSVAAGVEYCVRGDDGSITNTFTSTNTTLVTFMSKLRDIFVSKTAYATYGGDYYSALQDLMSGNAVFASARLNQVELYLSDMEDYMIVPCPKLTEAQSYRSSVHDAVQLYGINAASSNIPAAAATLELMAYYSYVDVRPVYYESALKLRYTTDDSSAEMIDLISNSVYSDFVYIWQFCSTFNGMGNLLREQTRNKNFSSTIKRREESFNTALETVMEDLKALDY